MKMPVAGMVVLLLLVSLPVSTAARESRVSTSHLDDDPVKKFPVPVLFGVSLASVVPDFGAPRGGGTREHEGQDMMAPKGTPIISPTDAVVTSVGDGESSGKYVSTANPGGESFRYMHLDTVANIKRGTRLKAGDLIGTVGDTGNAPEGAYHLHFEVLDGREPTDPYPRLDESLSLKEKAALLEGIMNKVRGDEDDYAELLVETFPNDFSKMLQAGYKLPREITTALKKTGATRGVEKLQALRTVLKTVPTILPAGISEGDQGPTVTLLQLFIIYYGDGPAASKLAAAGATGYYGPTTAAAVRKMQELTKVKETGVFDIATKKSWQSYDFE